MNRGNGVIILSVENEELDRGIAALGRCGSKYQSNCILPGLAAKQIELKELAENWLEDKLAEVEGERFDSRVAAARGNAGVGLGYPAAVVG